MGQSLAFEPFREDIFFVCVGPRDPTDEDWTRWLDFVDQKFWAAATCPGLLVMSGGGAPTPKQRERLNVLGQKRSYKMALVSDSILARGVATAINWFHRQQLRAFAPAAVERALAYVGVEPGEVPDARALLDRLAAQVMGTKS